MSRSYARYGRSTTDRCALRRRRAERGEQAVGRRQIDPSWRAREVVLAAELEEGAHRRRLDHLVDARVTHRLLGGDAGHSGLERRRVDVDVADRQDLARVLQRHGVEHPRRYAEALLRLPGLDEVLERSAVTKAS